MTEPRSLDKFLDKKQDYSPFLVHLTKDDEFVGDDEKHTTPAKDVLDTILGEKTLKAYNHYCYFSTALKESKNVSLESKFRVVCFTETPIDQIHILLTELSGRNFKPKPYGLVFKKSYIREKGGNPLFYVSRQIANPIYHLLYEAHIIGKEKVSEQLCKLLALVSLCEEGNDWHWEREWRVVGDLEFKLNDIYCGLCPEDETSYFENKYAPVKFISPNWGINKILDQLVKQMTKRKGGD